MVTFKRSFNMKSVLLWTSLYLVFFSGFPLADAVETLGPKCQKLAHEFAENPDGLNETKLKELQFCIAKTLEHRYKTNPPDLLKGTIIEPPSFSNEAPGTTPQTPSPNPGDQQ
jgi:hypothetical protein